MIPLIYVGYAVGVISIALVSIHGYRVSVDVWNNAEDYIEEKGDAVALIAGGAGLLLLGLLFTSRRK